MLIIINILLLVKKSARQVNNVVFFLTKKQTTFIQIDRVYRCNTNFAKNKKDESVNKLTSSMLIA